MSTPLEETDAPLCFRVSDRDAVFTAPQVELDQAQRTRIRSLSGMQKEALVTSTASGDTWRFVSDEGPYLDGADVAPPPLAFTSAGVVSSYVNEFLATVERRGVDVKDLEFVLDNYYSISGSALAGTMAGEALTPTLDVRAETDADDAELRAIAETTVENAPVTGLLAGEHMSEFALEVNGERVPVAEVPPAEPNEDPADRFTEFERRSVSQDESLVRHTGRKTERFSDADGSYTGTDAEGFADSQDRTIHVRATCTLREDGVKKIEQKLFSPRGSVFEFLSDEPEGRGGHGRAPDALTYVAVGLGFCFMTQLGRYADIVDADLYEYRIVQDTQFPAGSSDAEHGTVGPAESAETTLFLDGDFDTDFAQELLEMSEQTCYMHALCRTDLGVDVDASKL